MTFLDWVETKDAGATRSFLRNAGGDLLRAIGLTLDAAADAIRQGVKMRFPRYSPPDGLALLGEERQTPRATAIVYEDDRAYAARLVRLWDDGYWRGTAEGLRRALTALGVSDASIYHHGEWFGSQLWTTWVYLRTPQPWGPGPVLGDGQWTLGDGKTLGSSATIAQVGNVRAVLAPWLPPHTTGFLVIKTGSGPVLGDGQWTLGDGTVLGDAGVCAWRLREDTTT